MDGDSESPLRYPLGIRCRHLSVYASTHATYSGVAILSYVIRATCFLSIYAISDLRKVYIVLEIGTRCYGVRRDCRVCCVWTCRILRLDWGADVYLRTDHGAFVKYTITPALFGNLGVFGNSSRSDKFSIYLLQTFCRLFGYHYRGSRKKLKLGSSREERWFKEYLFGKICLLT